MFLSFTASPCPPSSVSNFFLFFFSKKMILSDKVVNLFIFCPFLDFFQSYSFLKESFFLVFFYSSFLTLSKRKSKKTLERVRVKRPMAVKCHRCAKKGVKTRTLSTRKSILRKGTTIRNSMSKGKFKVDFFFLCRIWIELAYEQLPLANLALLVRYGILHQANPLRVRHAQGPLRIPGDYVPPQE